MRKLLLASCAVLALSAGTAFTEKAFAQNTVNNSGTSTINGGASLGAGTNISGTSTLTGMGSGGSGANSTGASQSANGDGSGNATAASAQAPERSAGMRPGVETRRGLPSIRPGATQTLMPLRTPSEGEMGLRKRGRQRFSKEAP